MVLFRPRLACMLMLPHTQHLLHKLTGWIIINTAASTMPCQPYLSELHYVRMHKASVVQDLALHILGNLQTATQDLDFLT